MFLSCNLWEIYSNMAWLSITWKWQRILILGILILLNCWIIIGFFFKLLFIACNPLVFVEFIPAALKNIYCVREKLIYQRRWFEFVCLRCNKVGDIRKLGLKFLQRKRTFWLAQLQWRRQSFPFSETAMKVYWKGDWR